MAILTFCFNFSQGLQKVDLLSKGAKQFLTFTEKKSDLFIRLVTSLVCALHK